MATKDDKKNLDAKKATELPVQIGQQSQGAGGEQLPPLPGVLSTSVTGDPGAATGGGSLQQVDPGNTQQAAGPNMVRFLVDASGVSNSVGATIQPEGAGVVEQPEFIPEPVRVTVQAVAVPNKRRMRAGYLFTDEPKPFVREDFTDEQWELIENDPHLKIRRLEG